MLPRLTKVNARGSDSFWEIRSEGDSVYVRFGIDGGKIREVVRKCKAKNIGKSNETTPEQQAKEEALSRWKKKLDAGFVYNGDCEEENKLYKEVIAHKQNQGGHNRKETKNKKALSDGRVITSSVPNLMLCKNWEECKKKSEILNPFVFVEPKLDGVRAAAYKEGNVVVLVSRQGKQFPFLNHIKDALINLPNGTILDGELYVHSVSNEEGELSVNERFSFITGAVSVGRKNPHPKENLIQFHVFDTIDSTKCKADRYIDLDSIFCDLNLQNPIFLVSKRKVSTLEGVEEAAASYTAEGYEGVVLKTPSGMYSLRKGHRSGDVFKYKQFEDEEFTIVDACEASGSTEEGAVIWNCGDFKVRMRGSIENRRNMFENKQKYIGKKITVRFQGKYEDGTPRFPVGIAIRNYE